MHLINTCAISVNTSRSEVNHSQMFCVADQRLCCSVQICSIYGEWGNYIFGFFFTEKKSPGGPPFTYDLLQIKQGHTWTEMTADDKLYEIRRSAWFHDTSVCKRQSSFTPFSTFPYSEDPEFHSVSFESISAVGPNAAVIHYRADENTDRQINDQEVYLLDSGGQYTWDASNHSFSLDPIQHIKELFSSALSLPGMAPLMWLELSTMAHLVIQ